MRVNANPSQWVFLVCGVCDLEVHTVTLGMYVRQWSMCLMVMRCSFQSSCPICYMHVTPSGLMMQVQLLAKRAGAHNEWFANWNIDVWGLMVYEGGLTGRKMGPEQRSQ